MVGQAELQKTKGKKGSTMRNTKISPTVENKGLATIPKRTKDDVDRRLREPDALNTE